MQILESDQGIQIRVSRTEVHGMVFYKIFSSYAWIIVVWEIVILFLSAYILESR